MPPPPPTHTQRGKSQIKGGGVVGRVVRCRAGHSENVMPPWNSLRKTQVKTGTRGQNWYSAKGLCAARRQIGSLVKRPVIFTVDMPCSEVEDATISTW
jgi:hypothetical protein